MIFYCIFTFVAVKLSPEDVALFQQAEGVGLAIGGGEGQEVGGLWTAGEVESVGLIA